MKVLVVFGTRPEAIKLAPVILALRVSSAFEVVVAVTGQHREMLDQVLDVFGVQPDYDLGIIQPRQTLTDISVRTLQGLVPIMEDVRPSVTMVQGDTTTTLTGALAAFYCRIPVVHVEAGLRSNDIFSPYPEEMNRRLTSNLSALHLAPTNPARANLLREGVDEERVIVTGNTVVDALQWVTSHAPSVPDEPLAGIPGDRPLLLVTAHRRESWGEPLRAVAEAVAELARLEPGLIVVFPLHRNPTVRENVLPVIAGIENVRVIEPLAYGEFVALMNRSSILLTDSGGLQEEGISLGKPVLVMRDTTERPEAVLAGGARLVGTDRRAIVSAVRCLLHDPEAYATMARVQNPFGDGHASERVVMAVAWLLGTGPRPRDFEPVSPRQ